MTVLWVCVVLGLAVAQTESFLPPNDLSQVSCSSCLSNLKTLNDFLLESSNLDSEMLLIESICGYIIDPAICTAVGDSIGYVGRVNVHERYLDPEKVCADIGLCPAQASSDPPLSQYQADMIRDRPVLPSATTSSTITENLRVLVLSDIHIDLNYDTGSRADCEQPLCCRREDEEGEGVEGIRAGYWGTMSNCDIPERTVKAILSAAAELQPDIVLWLGDTTPHDVWNYSPEYQSKNVQVVTALIADYFPGKPVYPVIGNHECFPADQFLPGNESQLLNDLAEKWKIWLDQDTISQFLGNGFYTVKDEKSGLHLIALNTQMFDTSNFYLSTEPIDPGSMLQWLSTTLQSIESQQESALIFGHIPPGDHFADSGWSSMYQAIADRYRTTIKGHFYAHTHNAQFYVIDGVDGVEPVGVILAAPSMTTFTKHPPAIRLVEMDGGDFELVDFTDYIFPLDLANTNDQVLPSPILTPLYSAKSAYSLPDLSPQSWLSFSLRMSTDNSAFDTYWRLFNFAIETECNGKR